VGEGEAQVENEYQPVKIKMTAVKRVSRTVAGFPDFKASMSRSA
jgi:hypothetical protein